MRTHLALLLILLLAASLRVYHLDAKSFWYDEFASIELANGRGYARFELPTDQLISNPPNLTDLADAAPLKSLWFADTRGHVPPLYELLLRLWGEAFGLSQASARAFSLAASLAAIAMLFLAVRELSGSATALWAAALMTLAGPQIQFAQEARSYTLLLLVGLAAAAALVRIERRGPGLRREAALVAGLLATSLTHYFAAGALLALAVYAGVRLRGRARLHVAGCFLLAAALWLGLGAPVALRQAEHVGDPAATDFVRDEAPGHAGRTLARLAGLPVRYITEPMSTSTVVAGIGCVAFALAVLLPLRRRDLLLWGLWLVLTVLPIALLDLLRQTKHLEFMRYTLLASPALYGLVAGALSTSRWRLLRHLPPAAVALSCLLALPAAYQAWWKADWRNLGAAVERLRRPGDVLLFARAPNYELFMPAAYVHIGYYSKDPIRSIALLTRPPGAQLRRQLQEAPGLLLIANRFEDAEAVFPTAAADGQSSATLTPVAYEPGAAAVWRVTWPRNPSTAPTRTAPAK